MHSLLLIDASGFAVREQKAYTEIPKLGIDWTVIAPYGSITVDSDMTPICYVISKAIILWLNLLHNQNTCTLYNCTFVLCKMK